MTVFFIYKGGEMRFNAEGIFVFILLSLFFGGIIYVAIRSRLDEKKEKEEKNEKTNKNI
jgi:hypothetical protein